MLHPSAWRGFADGDGAGDWYEVVTIDTNPNGPQPNAPNAPNDPNLKPNIPYPLPAPDSTPPATNKPVKVYTPPATNKPVKIYTPPAGL